MCLPWRLLYQTCQVQGSLRGNPQQSPADPGWVLVGGTAVSGTLLTMEPLGRPELLQWDPVIDLYSEGFFFQRFCALAFFFP